MNGAFIVAPLFILIMLGACLRWSGFWKHDEKSVLIRLLYWVVLPALLFRTTYLNGGSIGDHGGFSIATHASLVLTPLIAFLLSRTITHRGDLKHRALTVMMSARSNCLYLGLPAIALAMGEIGAELASVYLAITLPGYNLITIFFAEIVMNGVPTRKSMRSLGKRIVTNPLIMSSLLGLSFAQLGIYVPSTVITSLKLLTDMSSGVALIALGASLELSVISDALRRTWLDVIIKLLIHPVVTLSMMYICCVDAGMTKVAALFTAMPIGVDCFIVAQGMGLDEKYACEAIAISTLFSVVSIPIWISLLGI